MFAIGAGYHSYFSHRAFSTGRVFQFILAVLAQSTAQKSVLWWAAKHRHHHLHSDTPEDVHSPRHKGFFYSHVGWIFDRKHEKTNLVRISDFAKYPELMWLHRFEVAPAVLARLLFADRRVDRPGRRLLLEHCLLSTMARSASIRWLTCTAHKRYVTGDDSRNNWLLALMTMGEGWHNNHHAYQSSVRQGFRWWEVDPTFYILKAALMARRSLGPEDAAGAVLRNEQRLGSRVIDKAAADLVATFQHRDDQHVC